jgi:type IV pilus assembly protein PilO
MAGSFNDYSSRTQLLILGALCLTLAAAAFQLLLSPARAHLAGRQARRTELAGELTRARATAARLPAAEQELRALERSLREATAILPDEKDPQDVLRHLHALASESALDLSRFTPKAIVNEDQYSEWPIELGLDGGYHDLGRFFARVATMSRLMSVTDLQIRTHAKPGSGTTISASCAATTFVFERLPIGTPVGGGEPILVEERSGYEPDDRRDPFVSLITPQRAAAPAALAPPRAGLAGLALADVSVKGIVQNGSVTLAVLEGPGGKSFVARSRDRLQDAIVKHIDIDGVLFAQQVVDAVGEPGTRDVRKSLRQTTVESVEEEGR